MTIMAIVRRARSRKVFKPLDFAPHVRCVGCPWVGQDILLDMPAQDYLSNGLIVASGDALDGRLSEEAGRANRWLKRSEVLSPATVLWDHLRNVCRKQKGSGYCLTGDPSGE